jgi:hypothetical protein
MYSILSDDQDLALELEASLFNPSRIQHRNNWNKISIQQQDELDLFRDLEKQLYVSDSADNNYSNEFLKYENSYERGNINERSASVGLLNPNTDEEASTSLQMERSREKLGGMLGFDNILDDTDSLRDEDDEKSLTPLANRFVQEIGAQCDKSSPLKSFIPQPSTSVKALAQKGSQSKSSGVIDKFFPTLKLEKLKALNDSSSKEGDLNSSYATQLQVRRS